MFKSIEGKKEVLDLYEKKLSSLSIKYKEKIIQTTFGATNILITGNAEKPPMLLIHGSNGCAPIALETYKGLEEKYQLFAVDVLSQPNKSDSSFMNMKNNDYGKWIYELIDHLNLKEVSLAGFSFGGLIILKTLEFKEENIKHVFLTAPAYIVNGNPLKALFKVFIPMKRYMKTKNVKFIKRFLNEIFSEVDDFAIKFLSKVFIHFKMDFAPVPVIKTKNAKKIKTPIHLIAAKNDLMFPGEKMLKRAQTIFSSLQYTMLLKSSKHVQNKDDNLQIVNYIKSV